MSRKRIDALQSFWGRGNKKRMGMQDTKLANGSKAGEREQRVLTPPVILEAVYRMWPRIALDPAGAPESLLTKGEWAADKWACPDEDCGADYTDGLNIDWPQHTYCNPEYVNLKAWLAHACKFDEVLLLGPVRTQRRWWRECILGYGRAICWLNSVQFVGFDAVFPAPLCMAYWGDQPDPFLDAFEPLGDVSYLSWEGAKPRRQMTLTFG